MAIEIERKFLLANDDWRAHIQDTQLFRHGYLIGAKHASVRIRIEGSQAKINIKSATLGIRRQEYEYPIPFADAEEILDTLCQQPLVEKKRHFVTYQGYHWEIDEFLGDNSGLIVAEIELKNEHDRFVSPPWLGHEVSRDVRYYNTELSKNPYKTWKKTSDRLDTKTVCNYSV